MNTKNSLQAWIPDHDWELYENCSVDLQFELENPGKLASIPNYATAGGRFVQPDGDKQPVIIKDPCGLYGAKFDGVDDFLEMNENLVTGLDTDFSVFAVFRLNQYKDDMVICCNKNHPDYGIRYFLGASRVVGIDNPLPALSFGSYNCEKGGWYPTQLDLTEDHHGNIMSLGGVWTDRRPFIHVSGTKVTYGQWELPDLPNERWNITVGKNWYSGNPSGCSDITLFRLFVFAEYALTDEDITYLEGWASHRYGLVLPNNHVYKEIGPCQKAKYFESE